jgi:putative SOS response-associated peptidase YedK
MCGRYTIKNPDLLAALISRLTGEPYEIVRARYNISPGQGSPTIRVTPQPHRVLERKWGHFARFAPDEPPMFLVNARSETALTKRTFAPALRERRCVVPADGFYEWKRDAKGRSKQAYHFQRREGAPYVMAGICWEPEGDQPDRFIVLTTAPNELLAPIHDRMPVMLREDVVEQWLDPKVPAERALGLCVPFPAAEMTGYPVSTIVNNAKNDVPECIVPVQPAAEPPAEEQGSLF